MTNFTNSSYSRRNKRAAIVIPVYRDDLDPSETLSLKSTFYHLGHRDGIFWLGPDGYDFGKLNNLYGQRKFVTYPPDFFRSVASYSQLLLTEEFYATFAPHFTHVLIVQTDATVLRDELDFWVEQPYHYIGAPWPNGWSFPLSRIFGETEQLRCAANVGNGGFSLRDISAIIDLLREFPGAREDWFNAGNPEDLYISLAASISSFFRVPNIRVASRFSIELDGTFFSKFGDGPPFGLHAWNKHNKDHYATLIRECMHN